MYTRLEQQAWRIWSMTELANTNVSLPLQSVSVRSFLNFVFQAIFELVLGKNSCFLCHNDIIHNIVRAKED